MSGLASWVVDFWGDPIYRDPLLAAGAGGAAGLVTSYLAARLQEARHRMAIARSLRTEIWGILNQDRLFSAPGEPEEPAVEAGAEALRSPAPPRWTEVGDSVLPHLGCQSWSICYLVRQLAELVIKIRGIRDSVDMARAQEHAASQLPESSSLDLHSMRKERLKYERLYDSFIRRLQFLGRMLDYELMVPAAPWWKRPVLWLVKHLRQYQLEKDYPGGKIAGDLSNARRAKMKF